MTTEEMLAKVAENGPKVYESGYKKGKAEGFSEEELQAKYEEGYATGYEGGYNKATEDNPFYYTYTLNTTFAGATFPENYDFVLRLKTQIGFHMPFQKARNIKSIKFIADDKTSIKRQAYGWFQWCYEVETIDLSEYGIVTLTSDCRSMFQDCSKLKTVKGVLDFTDVTNWYASAFNCKALEDIEFVPNTIPLSLSFSYSLNLSDESIQSIVDGLADLSDAEQPTILYLHSAVLDKLTAEQWETITAKNWTAQ